MKTKQIGPISFSEKGYAKFISLRKEEQIEKVYSSLSPKDRKYAEKILTHIPHGTGNISSGNGEEAQEHNAEPNSGGSAGNGTEQSGNPKQGKGKRTDKRGKTGQE